MNQNLLFEILLIILNCIVWLGPLFLAATRRVVSLIHPSSMFPLFVTTIMLIGMTEHWFGWSRRGFFHGLRMTTRSYHNYPDFFIIPLLIALMAGLAYHLGVYCGCGRIISGLKDRIHLSGEFRSIMPKYTIQLFIVGTAFSFLCITPFMLFGEGRGFFWTAALIYSFNFIPVILYNQKISKGFIFFLFGFLAVGLRGSKGDFIYYLLPLIIFNQKILFTKQQKVKILRLLFLGVIIMVVVLGTIKMCKIRNEWGEGSSILKKILVREHGFEVFSILVHETKPMGNVLSGSPYGSWLLQELIDAIPSVLGINKMRMSHVVARDFMPKDYAKMDDVAHNRFFLFSFYYDFGWIGALLGSCLFGFIIGSLYNLALKKTSKDRVLWPLFIYLPIPVYANLMANGSIPYGLVHIEIASLIIWIIIRLSTTKVIR